MSSNLDLQPGPPEGAPGEYLHERRYHLRKKLGQGGMGAVYLAEDTRLPGRLIAVKENLNSSTEAQSQFKREALMLARLRHPNLPQVTDYFIEADGKQYLVMDYVSGENLAQILKQRQGPLPLDEVLSIMDQVMQALAYMHAWKDPESSQTRPIIHRDIKPANIKRTPEGRVVLVDFGIAKVDAGTATATAVSAKALTPGYAPLEQYGGGTDARSDIYSLGATLFALLTGAIPPTATDMAMSASKQRTPLTGSLKTAPPRVAKVIERAMQSLPQSRFQSMAEMYQALFDRPLPGGATGGAGRRTPNGGNRRGLWPALVLGVGALLLVVGVWWLLAEQPPEVPIEVGATPVAAAGMPVAETPPPVQQADTQPVAMPPTDLAPIDTATITPTPTASATPTPVNTATATGTATGTASETPDSDATRLVEEAQLATAVAAAKTATAEAEATATTGAQQMGTAVAATLTAQATPTFTPSATPTPSLTASPTATATRTATPTPTDVVVVLNPLRLAFAYGNVGNTDIYVLDETTGATWAVADRSCDEAEPGWAPDGLSVIYQSDCGGSYDLYLVTVDGNNPQALTATVDRDEREPEFSPDGTAIAFRVNTAGNGRNADGALWVMDADGANARGLGVSGRAPSWSPDGRSLVYMSEQQSNWEIYIYNFAEGQSYRLTDCSANCRFPTWSPDGQAVAYHSTTKADTAVPETIWMTPATGGAASQLVSGASPGRPSWSRSGLLAFNSDRGIEVVDLNNGARRTLLSENIHWAPAWSR